jgi:hypothetical protein
LQHLDKRAKSEHVKRVPNTAAAAAAAADVAPSHPSSFIPPPSISTGSEPIGHVTALIESCAATNATSGSAAASFHHIAQSSNTLTAEGDSFAPAVFQNSDAKHVHALYKQQQQQQQQQQDRTHHSVMHNEFASSLLSRPFPQTPDITADKVAQASSRELPSFKPAFCSRR